MLRPMTERDIPVVLAFIRKTLQLDPHFNDKQRLALQVYATPKAMENAIQHYYTIVDERHNRVVGMGSISGNHIVYVYVDPLEQGQGIGKSLMDNLMQHFVKKDKIQGKSNFITVFSTELAVPFYAKFGFRIMEKLKHTVGGQEIIRTRMQLDVK